MLSVKQKLVWFGVATCSLALATAPAQAGTLFNQSQTGVELFNNPDVAFPGTAPIVNGSAIDFGTGTNGEAVLVWDLLPAASRGDLDIAITVDYTPLTGDNDPIFGIFDGSNFLGLQRINNFGGELRLRRGAATPTELPTSFLDATPLGGIGPVEPFSYDLWIADGGAGPASVSNVVEGADSAAGPFFYQNNFIDTDNALSFVLYRTAGTGAGSADFEQYRINSLAISIEEKDVPEPSVILGMVGAIALGFLRRKTAVQQ